ncbi:putative signal transducing protein [Bacteroides finegoldii]|uniref:putative signal transducing protein n=1 Tax=Bacteroides finegoldii TaxID=338188 RepID=UPI00189E1926|nr:DUF2007 domain-containing protein [Bacteroides finegoldii]
MKLLVHCENSILADEYKANLEAKGILCYIQKEEVGIGAYTGGGQPQVAIFVEDERYQEAIELINGLKFERDSNLPWCPKCGSENVTYKVIKHKSGFMWWTLLFLIPMVIGFCISLTGLGEFIKVYVFAVIPVTLLFSWYKSNKEKPYHCNQCENDFKRT